GVAEYTAQLLEALPSAQVEPGPPDARRLRVLHVQHETSLFSELELTRHVQQVRHARVPVAVTEHRVAGGARPWEREADALVATTEAGAGLLRARWRSKRIEHIPIGCPTWFPPRKRERGRVIGGFGFLEPHKGFWTLLEALGSVPETELLLFSYAKSAENDARWRDASEGLPARRVGQFVPAAEAAARLAAEADVLAFWYDETEAFTASAAVRVGLATGVPVLTSPTRWFDDVRDVTYQPRHLVEGVERLLHD